MQPKYTHNSSNVIKATEEAKRKSRHRLIGSIALLFIALVALLNVTSKVKPIAINPNVVEIKQDSKLSASSVIAKTALESGIVDASTPTVAQSESTSGVVQVKATRALPLQGDISQPALIEPTETKAPIIEKPKIKKIIKIDPSDILNDTPTANINNVAAAVAEPAIEKIKTTSTKGNSYIQFAALSTPEKAQNLQSILASHGINASVQPIQTQKGTLYRLRAGPFNRNTAEQQLNKISAQGYSGIITGN